MPLNLTCPSCQSRLQIPEQFAGRKVKCPTCASVFDAQNEAAPSRRQEEQPIPLRRDDAFDAPRPRRAVDERDDVPLPRRPRDDYDDGPRRPRDDDDDRLRRLRDDYDDRPPRPRDDDDFDEDRPRRRRRQTNTGMIVGMILGGAVLLVAVIVLIVVIVKNSDGLPGTTWSGHETLPGMGRLEFRFQSRGECTMIDAGPKPVTGKFTRNGNKVTITFGDAQYDGTINGDTMSGTARFTVPVNVQKGGFGVPNNWTWNVKRK
jgi:predicted Zn finger-like uncharacterized protein